MIKVLSGTLFLTVILVLSGCWNGNTAINFGDHSLGDQLIDLKKALEKQVQKEPQDVVRDIPPDDWDNLVGTASLLRSSLAKDIGARRKPAIKDS